MARETLLATTALLIIGILYAVPTIAGPKWEFGEDGWMTLSVLGQVYYSLMEDVEDEHDFYLRRGRFIVQGQVIEGVKFFAETDYPNAGRNGSDAEFIIQDAFVDVQLFGSDHWVKGGLILLPFSFENRTAAIALLGIDYNVEVIKFVNDWTWRDVGASLQGSFGKRIGYKAGIFDGYKKDEKNFDADLRVTGRIDVALIGEVPTGWYYIQDGGVAGESYLHVGGGVDYQNKATLDNSGLVRDEKSWVLDFQSGFNVSDTLYLIVHGAWYDWDNSNFDGNTAFVESGLRYDKLIGTLKYSLQDSERGSEIQDYTVGLQYNLKGNNMKGGIEYRWGDSSDWWLVGIQFLL